MTDPLHELPKQLETMTGAGAKTVASDATVVGAVLIAAISTNPYMQFTPLVSVEGVPIHPIGSVGKIAGLENLASMSGDYLVTIDRIEPVQPDGAKAPSANAIEMTSSFG